ncbi:sigma 54-interacting transcriptional regulator [Wukongibacter sp. M2B1]|uniref:sigma 54-interacting transcriptional regulator n=1 Tax=Wukongibacter sp. M2B1 TaxID=3088895 RepID=UPI003D7ACFE6
MLLGEDILLEKKLFIDVNEKDYFKVIETFQLAQTTQLPVTKDDKLVGILDLFSFVKMLEKDKNVMEIMEKDIIIAKKDNNISDCKLLKQKILPFVDETELYIGFIESSVIEKQLLKEKYSGEIQYYKDLQQEYQAIFESSYDGITITDGKGIILRINPAGERVEGLSSKDVVGKYVQELVDLGIYSESATIKALEKRDPVTILQKVPSGKEIIATGTPIFENGEIIRVITNSRDITELNNLKRELSQAHQLAEKYQSELEFLRLEQMKTEDIVVHSPEMKKIVTLATRVAPVDSTVLIQGESGVGKGILSKLIHNNSKRKNGPFIKIDCGSIPESLLESELFGYEKGAFTGAKREGKIGLIELANGGTLFLDEIGEVPLNLQVKLLRVLQDREIVRVGGSSAISVDIRIIAATNRELETMVKEKNFREDLYYRLNVVPIFIPPLRERKDDIQPLVMNSLERFNRKYKFQKKIECEALEFLIQYDWPGNIRELENIIERLVVVTNEETIRVENIPRTITEYKKNRREEIFDVDDSLAFRETMAECERRLLITVMKKSKSIQEIADILKLDRSSVRKKLKKHGIEKTFRLVKK